MLKDRPFKIIVIIALTMILFSALSSVGHITNTLIIPLLAYLLATTSILVHKLLQLFVHVRKVGTERRSLTRISQALFISILFGCTGMAAISALWTTLLGNQSASPQVSVSAFIFGMIVILPSILFYETMLLNKEIDWNNNLVRQLDSELTEAELTFLKNELDPHFVYNTLMPLYYLIKNDSSKAAEFTFRLMQIYQHFLKTRKKTLVLLEEECRFVENYIYLLHIRFQHSMQLTIDGKFPPDTFVIVPLTMQLLIENAIKHSEIGMNQPTQIHVYISNEYITISNSLANSDLRSHGIGVGLNNLRLRYKYILNKNIRVYTENRQFIVQIPLTKKQSQHDVRRYHRG